MLFVFPFLFRWKHWWSIICYLNPTIALFSLSYKKWTTWSYT